MLDPGQPAPDFELPNQHDETVSLSDFRGQRVVLYFYPRADTPGCTAEACNFRDRWPEYEAHDVAVLGVSIDPVSDLADFAEEYDLPFHLLSDEDGSVSEDYGSYGERTVDGDTVEFAFRNTYVIDADGQIEFAYKGVDPEDHADDILADLA